MVVNGACSPMTRVVKVLWTASRAQGKKTDRRQITGNDYTGMCAVHGLLPFSVA